MNEDITTVSPTLGFIIKTIDYEGYISALTIHVVFTDPFQATNSTSVWTCTTGRPIGASSNASIPGDVGGQKTLRSYWRNYFEKTDALIWVVDATDRLRIDDCRVELAGLLLEEASSDPLILQWSC